VSGIGRLARVEQQRQALALGGAERRGLVDDLPYVLFEPGLGQLEAGCLDLGRVAAARGAAEAGAGLLSY
jgi:hypothetical protein